MFSRICIDHIFGVGVNVKDGVVWQTDWFIFRNILDWYAAGTRFEF